jgi:hypothetical protein
MFEIRLLNPLQALGNLPIIGECNWGSAHGEDLSAGRLSDLDVIGITIEFRSDLLANPGPAMRKVNIRRGNPATVAQFSNGRRHEVRSRAMSRLARSISTPCAGSFGSPGIIGRALMGPRPIKWAVAPILQEVGASGNDRAAHNL